MGTGMSSRFRLLGGRNKPRRERQSAINGCRGDANTCHPTGELNHLMSCAETLTRKNLGISGELRPVEKPPQGTNLSK